MLVHKSRQKYDPTSSWHGSFGQGMGCWCSCRMYLMPRKTAQNTKKKKNTN